MIWISGTTMLLAPLKGKFRGPCVRGVASYHFQWVSISWKKVEKFASMSSMAWDSSFPKPSETLSEIGSAWPGKITERSPMNRGLAS